MSALLTMWKETCSFLPKDMVLKEELNKIYEKVGELPQDLTSSVLAIEYPINTGGKWIDWGFILDSKDEAYNCPVALGYDTGSRQSKTPGLFVFTYENSAACKAFFSNCASLKSLQKIQKAAINQDLTLHHFAFLLGRQEEAIRLNFMTKKTAADDLFSDIAALGFSNTSAELLNLLKFATNVFDRFQIGIDAGDEIGPRLGLKGRLNSPNWKHVLSTLQEYDFISAEKKDLLLQWPGATFIEKCLYTRTIDHIKFIYREGQKTQCKAYLKTKIDLI